VRIQDLSSQAVVGTLDLAAGLSFLDVCAAPGGKMQQAVELLQSADRAVACDRSVRRLTLARRLGPIPVAFVAADAEIQLPLRRLFDRILVDAPCSGTGTLARNPDIKWRLEQRDLDELPRRQKAILRSALALLEPSGTLVYSTCSLEPEENQAVVELALAERPDLVAAPVLERLPGRDAGDGFQAFRITTKRQSG
jgi:16S rRNA (cytosine967-C5)-methyltransferase